MGTTKDAIRRRPKSVIRKGLPESLPTSVQKSYFMLSDAERVVLNTALEKYRPGQSEPILVGGNKVLKPALRLMTLYRLVIEELHPMGGCCASKGSGRSGSFFDIQSAL
jgi:hypothetical protein